MSLLLDKTGHFVGIQPNREDGLQINPHDFLLYSITIQMGRDRREMGLRGIPGFHPPVAPLPITGLFVVNLSRFACRPFFVDNRGMDELRELQATMRGCRICAEAGYDIVPGAVFQGRVGARAMIIGQAPGVTEVVAKRPFNAGSGRRLFQWLGEAGWEEDDFRGRHYMTSVTKCYPGKHGNGKGDRVPTKVEQGFCRPYLEREIALVNPRLIIPVGGLAIKLFYPASARLQDIIGRGAYFPAEALAGNRVNFRLRQAERLAAFDGEKGKDGRWIVPLPHPSGASLWPNKPENQVLIERAIGFLGDIRVGLGL